ncbi:hypothetical protein ACIQYS_17415 [Psychrobacillus sp. NPDC096426]|uniref:hypothetical protein n=1 Tax=Psychrobacillus sp. NPDC096426 TaxID=3364491 RepID=UPI003820B431
MTVQHPTTHTLTMFQAVLAEAGIEYTKEKVFQAATPNSATFCNEAIDDTGATVNPLYET